jgi:hypothetical protein
VFAALTEEQLQGVAAAARAVSLAHGSQLLLHRRGGEGCYIVAAGDVSVFVEGATVAAGPGRLVGLHNLVAASHGAGDAVLGGGAREGALVLTATSPGGATLLPLVDAATHSAQIRFKLPALSGVVPGMFARVWLPAAGGAATSGERLFVPSAAVVRRAELTAVYLMDAQGRPALRQVRLGRVQGERVEVLSGLRAGDKVATDPTAAAQVR